MVALAHPVRASGCGPEGNGFDPRRSPAVPAPWELLVPAQYKAEFFWGGLREATYPNWQRNLAQTQVVKSSTLFVVT